MELTNCLILVLYYVYELNAGAMTMNCEQKHVGELETVLSWYAINEELLVVCMWMLQMEGCC